STSSRHSRSRRTRSEARSSSPSSSPDSATPCGCSRSTSPRSPSSPTRHIIVMIPRRLAALAALGLLLAACSAGAGTGGELQATHWILHSYDQDGTLAIAPQTVFADAEFANYRMTGTSG